MELKPGYKKTEAGVIPDVWEVYELSELITAGPKNGYSGRCNTDERGTPTLSLSSTSSGKLVLNKETIKYLEERLRPGSEIFLLNGDVLVQRANTAELVGTTAIFDGPSEVFAYPDLMMRLRFRETETAHWFWRYANSRQGKRYFSSVASGSTGSMPKISSSMLRQMLVPLPPLNERCAIMETLNEIDRFAASLKQALTKKHDIKQAAMQELLTGKRRLPGFEGEWEVKRFGDIATIDPENLCSNTQPHYRFNYISLEDVDQGSLLNWSEQEFSSSPSRARRKLRHNDVLVSTVRPSLKSHLLFSQDNGDWVCSTGFATLRCNGELADPGYIFFHLFGSFVNKQIEALLTGSNYPAISSRDVRSLEIPVPALSEQKEIARILTSMEDEIISLTQRLEKASLLKQGMMEQLLTGKIRLT